MAEPSVVRAKASDMSTCTTVRRACLYYIAVHALGLMAVMASMMMDVHVSVRVCTRLHECLHASIHPSGVADWTMVPWFPGGATYSFVAAVHDQTNATCQQFQHKNKNAKACIVQHGAVRLMATKHA